MFKRYAIYFVPDGRLAQIGAQWLGWDIVSGTAPERSNDALALVNRPKKYGFHATIKAPFRLAFGTDQEALENACVRVCGRLPAVQMDGLHVKRMGRMMALVPNGDESGIRSLAAEVVRELDPFRAPMPQQEIASRQKPWLSPAQRQNLLDWGYPYVLDQFRFHMTLTNPLNDTEAQSVISELQSILGSVVSQPLTIERLALVGEGPDGFFNLIRWLDLGSEGT